jgi:CheY-like chemotaxis protein
LGEVVLTAAKLTTWLLLAARRSHAHNNVEQSEAQINLSGMDGLVLLHDSDPTFLAHLQRMCIERLWSNANMIRTLPSLYAIEALVDQSPCSFELVLMDLTQDSEGGLVLAQKLRAHNVPVVVTANRQAFSPTQFVRLLQARPTPHPPVLGALIPVDCLPSFGIRIHANSSRANACKVTRGTCD